MEATVYVVRRKHRSAFGELDVAFGVARTLLCDHSAVESRRRLPF